MIRHDVRIEEVMPAYEAAEAKLKELQETIANLRSLHMVSWNFDRYQADLINTSRLS